MIITKEKRVGYKNTSNHKNRKTLFCVKFFLVLYIVISCCYGHDLDNRKIEKGEVKENLLLNISIMVLEWSNPWFLYQMVAHFTMRTHGVIRIFDLLKAFG